MSDGIRQPLENLSNHSGHFAGFIVTGIRVRSTDGLVSWKLTMWNDSDSADYWLTGKEFRQVGTHIFDPAAGGGNTYAIGPVTEPEPEELIAMEAALAEWKEHLKADATDY